jgi:tetratricopeptide (TPR) repeat protein
MANKLLILVIVVELICAAIVLKRQADLPRPPAIDYVLSKPPAIDYVLLDSATEQDIQAVYDKLVAATVAGPGSEGGSDIGDGWFELAKAYAAFGYYHQASECYRRAGELLPNNLDIAFHYALCLDRLARFDDAVDQFRRVQQHTDTERRKHECSYFIGNIYLKSENVAEAEKSFREGQAYAPCTYQLAKILIRSDRPTEAEPLLKSLDRFGNSIRTHMLRGNLHEALGQPKLAAQSFAKAEHAIEIPFYISDRTFLKSVRSQYGAPRMLSEARKLAENGKSYESVHRLRESLKHDYVEMPIRNLIRMQMEIGSTDDAIKTIDEFIEHAGHTPTALELQGDIRWSQRDQAGAQQSWERALKMQASVALHRKVGQLYESQLNKDKENHHRIAHAEQYAVDEFRRHDLERAASLLRGKTRARALFYYGLVMEAMNKPNEARAAFEQCLNVQPHHGRAKAALKRLVN